MTNQLHKKETGSGKNLIIYIHGNSSSSGVFENQHDRLSRNYRQISIDLPGCGQSFRSESPETDYSLSGLKKTVLETITALEADKILLVGHSLGGHIALEIAG